MKILVAPAGEWERRAALFTALEKLFPVRFVPYSGNDSVVACGMVVFGQASLTVPDGLRRDIPCYVVVDPPGGQLVEAEGPVSLGAANGLLKELHGKVLASSERIAFVPLSTTAGTEVVGTKGGFPFWIQQAEGDSGAPVDLVSLEPGSIAPGEGLSHHLHRDRFVRLLPLIHFLRRLTNASRSVIRTRRACIVIDDPSLNRPSYGCLSFAGLREHAQSRNYHASIATVPLSCSRISDENASLFRKHAEHISLTIHGNDHTRFEMCRDYPEAERFAILAQAVQRVARLENTHGVRVCRVMEPPYGILGNRMSEPLARLGYSAALVTPLQFLKGNPGVEVSSTFGLEDAPLLPGGLCMVPRIRMAPDWESEVILADLLHQPIVVAGHHYDASEGMVLFERIAALINSLGPVRWCSLSEIASGSYRNVRDGSLLRVRAGGRFLRIAVPEGVDRIELDRPWVGAGEKAPLTVQVSGSASDRSELLANGTTVFEVHAGVSVEVVSPPPNRLDPADVPTRGTHIWPLVRKVLTELRDRTYPYLHRARSNGTTARTSATQSGGRHS